MEGREVWRLTPKHRVHGTSSPEQTDINFVLCIFVLYMLVLIR